MGFMNRPLRDLGEVPEPLLAAIEERLERQLSRQEDLWERENLRKPNRFGVFRSTDHIVFQFPRCMVPPVTPGSVHREGFRDSMFFDNWKDWKDVIGPVVEHAGRSYGYGRGGATSRIMLARLHPGGEIPLHVDHNPVADVPHKIHVPLSTAPGVEFWIDGETHHLERGRAYEVHNKVPHGGCNRSASHRLHLIFEYFDASAASFKPGRKDPSPKVRGSEERFDETGKGWILPE